MTQKELVKLFQIAMNEAGCEPKFAGTGNFGPQTERLADEFEFTVSAKRKAVSVPADWYNAIWVGANNDLLGLDETDPRLNARFVPHWRKVGLPGYKTLVGNRHAHCSLVADANFAAVGVKGSGSAGAASWSKWGEKSPFWFGSVLDIKHKGGGRHVCIFLYWIDEKRGICATKDSNRSNKYGIFATDLSGKGDTLVTGPRWPSGWLKGSSPSMEEVLKKYPMLKVRSSGASTR